MRTATPPPGLTHLMPACLALGLAQNRTARNTDTITTRIGHLMMFQTRTVVSPTPMASMTLDARMNAATYPDADHSATRIPTTAPIPAPVRLLWACPMRFDTSSALLPGAIDWTCSVTCLVVSGPRRPRTATRTMSAGTAERVA